MAKTILVVLRPENNVRHLVRRLASVVNPGDHILLLLKAQLDISMWLLGQVASLQTGFDHSGAWQNQSVQLSWERQNTWAKQNLAAPTRRAFSHIPVEVEVDLYRISVTSIIGRLLNRREVALILMANSSWQQRIRMVPISLRNRLVRRLRYYSRPSLIHSLVKGKWLQ